jgi:ABC-2 type transport system permease protein
MLGKGNAMLDRLLNWRFWPLFKKELRQIGRNRKLVAMLVVPPTLNLVLLGFAMNPDVTNLKVGVVDESRTADSRELA